MLTAYMESTRFGLCFAVSPVFNRRFPGWPAQPAVARFPGFPVGRLIPQRSIKDRFCPLGTLCIKVLLPHELVASIFLHCRGLFHYIFTGLPGALEGYWRYNSDLAMNLDLYPADPDLQ